MGYILTVFAFYFVNFFFFFIIFYFSIHIHINSKKTNKFNCYGNILVIYYKYSYVIFIVLCCYGKSFYFSVGCLFSNYCNEMNKKSYSNSIPIPPFFFLFLPVIYHCSVCN